MLYPKDRHTGERTFRESPRKLFPTLPEDHPPTRSVRVVCENPALPNQYLYLLQYTSARVATYAFHTPNGERWKDTFPSIYEACVTAARAGYLDASW